MVRKMLTMIIYDIQETTNRNHLIKKLRHHGLKRVQKSVFTGYLTQEKRKQLQKEIKENIQSQQDSIIQLEICANCKNHITQLGNTNIPPKEDKEYEVLL